MIIVNADPVGHKSPRPRIDFSPKREPLSQGEQTLSFLEIQERQLQEAMLKADNDRIWHLVVQSSSGGLAPAPARPVDQSGWEAA